jgi:hypothetical protein
VNVASGLAEPTRELPAAAARRRAKDHLLSIGAAPLIACVWFVVVFCARWPAFRTPSFVSDSMVDSSFFGYAGELVRTGGIPYLTFWDHKAPLIFLVDAAALAVSGGQVWGLWLFNLLLFIGAALLAHSAMRRAFGALPAFVGTTYFAFSIAALFPVNMTEGYVLPLQWAAVLVLLRHRERIAGPLRAGMAMGVLGALAFFLRANLIGAAASVWCALLIAQVLRSRRGGAGGRDGAVFVAGSALGGVTVAACVVAYFASRGALAAFWDQAFRYNFIYSASGLPAKAGAMFFGTMLATQYSSAVLPFAGWILAARRVWHERRSHPVDPVYLLAVIWPVIEIVLGGMSGRHYGHYFAPSYSPVCFLGALLIAELIAIAPAAFSRGKGALALRLLAVGAVLPAMGATAFHQATDKAPPARIAQVGETADYVRRHTEPGARVLVWGHASEVHFFSGRGPASRFVYPLALLTPRYADRALVDGFIDELRATAPPLIIDATPNAASGDDLVPSLAQWNPAWHYPKEVGRSRYWWRMTPELKAFYDYVHANYAVEVTLGPKQWVVYRRITPVAQAWSTASGP